MEIIYGDKLAFDKRQMLKQRLIGSEKKCGLAVVIVGNDPASKIYVRNKIRACNEVGILSFNYELDESVSEGELLELIDKLNVDERIHGILVQLPLPKSIDATKVIERIDKDKDVDGFTTANCGALATGISGLYPCTPLACLEMIKSTGESIRGKHAVVIGRSNIVGKPVAQLLLRESATVTICHSATHDLKKHTLSADILVAAIGKPCFVTADMVKEGAIVIDVGINRLASNKLVGDVDYENVAQKCSFITPVPKGVGPMTIAMLLNNTVSAFIKANGEI